MTAAATRGREATGTIRVGSLFAGIGGFDLAARWMGWETAWFSEIDPYASAVLAKHWPGVPNHGDITQIDFTQVEPVDLLCGGFPCQDISNAGKRAGIDGERSGLWVHFARAIRELRPRYVVVENVAALLGRGIGRVLGDFSEIGYDVQWRVLSAADVGAPHRRERIWIVAFIADTTPLLGAPLIRREPNGTYAGARAVADPEIVGRVRRGSAKAIRDGGSMEPPRRDGCPSGWWAAEPDVGRVAHGIPARVDRLRGLGNAVVPQCVYQVFQTIQAAEDRLAETWSPCPACQMPGPEGGLCAECATRGGRA